MARWLSCAVESAHPRSCDPRRSRAHVGDPAPPGQGVAVRKGSWRRHVSPRSVGAWISLVTVPVPITARVAMRSPRSSSRIAKFEPEIDADDGVIRGSWSVARALARRRARSRVRASDDNTGAPLSRGCRSGARRPPSVCVLDSISTWLPIERLPTLTWSTAWRVKGVRRDHEAAIVLRLVARKQDVESERQRAPIRIVFRDGEWMSARRRATAAPHYGRAGPAAASCARSSRGLQVHGRATAAS